MAAGAFWLPLTAGQTSAHAPIVRPGGERPNIHRLHSQPGPRNHGGHARAYPPAEDHLRRDARRGVRGLLIYCADYKCSHWTTLSGDTWPDDVHLSDLEPRFTC